MGVLWVILTTVDASYGYWNLTEIDLDVSLIYFIDYLTESKVFNVIRRFSINCRLFS
jgi:hypothetical protein